MKEIIIVSIYGILTALVAISAFIIRRERKIIVEAEIKINKEVTDAQEVLDMFYKKLDELMTGFVEISDSTKSKSEPEDL